MARADGIRNAPLTGHKSNLYEGGIRVPLLMQWSGRLPENETYSLPVSALDILPTVLAASDVEPEGHGLDGVDLLPYLRGERRGLPHRELFWRSGPNAAVRQGRWKLLRIGQDLVRLYDVAGDPSETRDLSAQRPQVVAALTRALKDWERRLPPADVGTKRVITEHNGDRIEWHL